MAGSDNKFEIKKDGIIELVESEGFNNLSDEMQKRVLNSIGNENESDGGIMGKFLGNKKENAALHIAFIICVLLTIVGIVCMKAGNERWDVIIPAIMTAVGYMFGVGIKS